MDESAVEQEKQPITLFPVSEQSVSAALTEFGNLNPQDHHTAQVTNGELRILRETNPHVLTCFEELIESYSEDDAANMRLGNLMCYRVLREEARSKGLTIPTLTDQFVKDYEEQKAREADEYRIEAVRDRSMRGVQAARKFRRRNLVLFRNFEPEFSRIIEERLGAAPNWKPEDDHKYLGMIAQYLLFREGFSDPKNFQST